MTSKNKKYNFNNLKKKMILKTKTSKISVKKNKIQNQNYNKMIKIKMKKINMEYQQLVVMKIQQNKKVVIFIMTLMK